MIPVYICDDEKNILTFLGERINQIIMIENYPMEIVYQDKDPQILFQTCRTLQHRGIYFLDVDLKNNDYNGFTMAKEIRKIDPRGYIIFITTHGELAFDSFKHRIEAMDYILKDDVINITERIQLCLKHVTKILKQEKNQESQYFIFKVYDELYTIPFDEILYFETSSNKHRIIIHTDHMIMEYFDQLNSIESKVGDQFIRSYRSYLISKKRIKKVDLKASLIILDNQETCLISRKFKKDIRDNIT